MKNIVAGAVAVLLVASPARAWGPEGHAVVAMLAEAQLSPAAKTKIRKILFGAPLVTGAIMPDDIRISRPETARWHFVDIPYEEDHFDAARDCALEVTGDCVVAAIAREEDLIANPEASVYDRADALKRLVHFVGDIHQPFHAIQRIVDGESDQGGNFVKVTFFDDKKANLHSVWDSGLILHANRTAEQYVDYLSADVLPKLTSTDRAEADPIKWAESSHGIGKAAYVDNNAVLGDDYFKAHIGEVDQQLALAGVRLAAILEALPDLDAPAYFTFEQAGPNNSPSNSFVFKLVNQKTIAMARKILKTGMDRHVQGTITVTKAPYNPQWSYSLVPESIGFFEQAIELCDANMAQVEQHLDEIGGSYLPKAHWCPWSSQLKAEITNKIDSATGVPKP
ncbi:S1/P1 nuclease [Mesorhizobium sp. L2C067A000]|uniref:S1/P1 nuclease n=1 Tax=Mesorhizobium sp. L2C067A000 TaxID=1287106 RepID=UPI0018C9CBAC|nr:S1/P1 nuclease [Mesorhizobium sp. L2C067A000]